jgi:hypothetical protein
MESTTGTSTIINNKNITFHFSEDISDGASTRYTSWTSEVW